MHRQLVAVDIGNSRYHVARYQLTALDGAHSDLVAVPWNDSADIVWHGPNLDTFPLTELPGEALCWFLVSVNRQREAGFRQWIERHRPADQVHRLAWHQMQLSVAVEHPDRVGLDRLAAARASLQWRSTGQPVIVVDIGTAITVDYVDAAGVFQGGAILPGVRAALDALHVTTDALPRLVDLPSEAPPLPGKNTEVAIAAGVYYGLRAAVAALVSQFVAYSAGTPLVLVTGAREFVEILKPWQAQWVPDLVVRGVALAGKQWLEQTLPVGEGPPTAQAQGLGSV